MNYKYYLSAFLMFLFIGVNSQNTSKIDAYIEKYIDKSTSFDDLKSLLSLIENNTLKYQHIFKYIPSINPLNPKKQKRISSKFGRRFHPIDKVNKPHFGIDISAKAGTPIHATADGIIESTLKKNTGYGNQVVIQHKYGYKTRYAHMYLFIVKKGLKVTKGEIIGFVGSTGKSTANHIHFEVIKNNKRIDPYPFFSLKF